MDRPLVVDEDEDTAMRRVRQSQSILWDPPDSGAVQSALHARS
jgi:hypothetical protein